MAAYTPCTTGTVALYQTGEQLLAVPVEAWDETGAAYVAGSAGLVTATTPGGFQGLEAAATALPRKDRPIRTPERAGPRPRPHGPREKEGA